MDHVTMFRRLFWIMLVLAVPTVLLSDMFAGLLGYDLPEVPGLTVVSPVLGTVIYLWGGRPFLTGAVAPRVQWRLGTDASTVAGAGW